MTLTGWAHLAAVVVVLAWWGRGTVRALEWVDLQRDQARARQHRMAPTQWVKVHAVAALPRWIVAGPATAAAVAIGVAAWRYPTVAWAGIGLGLVVNGARNAVADPSDIAQLRQALGQIIGVDDRGRPPKVRRDGQHPSGGPLRITIAGHPGFKYWEKAKREQVEHAIEATLPGDWEVVEWRGDGTSVWERMPELPERVDYTDHLPDLPWHLVPVGIGGDGRVVTADLSLHPHWLVAGSTGFGKTSWLRVAAAWLLHRGVQVAAIDINYAGLAFLEGRPGVVAAMDSFEQIQATIAGLRAELRDRLTQLKRREGHRPPLVIFVDELEVLLDRAKAQGAKAGKIPQVEADLLEIGRTGRKVDMHLILATQRPEGRTIPMALRDNALGRLAVGPMGQAAAKMVLDDQFARAEHTPKIKGRTALRCGDWLGWVQSFWLADPDDERHDEGDRQAARALLPPRVIPPQGVPHTPGGVSVAAGVILTEGGETVEDEQMPKPSRHADASPHASAHATVTPIVTVDPLTRRRAADAERSRRYRANLIKALRNPDDPRHGTKTARKVGCECRKCQPAVVEVSS